MENQDEAVPKSGAINLQPGLSSALARTPEPAEAPATGIRSGGDRLLFGTPHPDGAAPATSGTVPENGASPTAQPPTGGVHGNPLGTVIVAVAAGFLLGRLLP